MYVALLRCVCVCVRCVWCVCGLVCGMCVCSVCAGFSVDSTYIHVSVG